MEGGASTGTPTPTIIDALPGDVLLYVFRYFSKEELCTTTLVCKTFMMVASNNFLWRPIFEASPYMPWWQPFKVSMAFEKTQPKRPYKVRDYRKEYALNARATKAMLQWYSFIYVAPLDTDSDRTTFTLAQKPVKWERTQTEDGKFGPKKIGLRALIVGGDRVGKNSLSRALQSMFPTIVKSLDHHLTWRSSNYEELNVPSTYGNIPISVTIEVGGILPSGDSFELVQQERYDDVRPNIVLVLFSVRDIKSFTRLQPRIMPAVKAKYNDLPILLVGTKAERNGSVEEIISTERALAICQKVGTTDYVEVSVINKTGIGQVLENVLRLGVLECLQRFARQTGSIVPTEEGEEGGVVVHDEIQCNGCKICPIAGQCFKCSTCKDFHFCSSCHETSPHSNQHTFTLRTPRPSNKRGQKRKAEVVQTHTFGLNFSHRNSAYSSSSVCATTDTGEENGFSELSEEATRPTEPKKPRMTIATTATPTTASPIGEGDKQQPATGSPCAIKGVELGEKWKAQVDDLFSLFSKSPKKD